jgi:hypothetical protein
MYYVNVVADFMVQPTLLSHALARFAAFVLMTIALIWISHHVGTPVSIGWMFGYLWGGLTVYGSLRPLLKQ